MTITRDGSAMAYYLGNEVVCPRCATKDERASCELEGTLAVDELEGAVDELWCDRCDAALIAREKEACCT